MMFTITCRRLTRAMTLRQFIKDGTMSDYILYDFLHLNWLEWLCCDRAHTIVMKLSYKAQTEMGACIICNEIP